MNKKKWFKKLFGVLILLACINMVVFGAISLSFKSINIWLSVIGINFSGPWNEFLGSLLIDKIVDLTGSDIQTINLGGKSRICSKQILWLYFNSQRWNRLRPLDQSSWEQLKEISPSYDDLTEFIWWLYTNCIGTWIDASSIFGQIKHVWKWETYYIVAWTQMNYNANQFIPSFADSFQLFDVNQWILSLWFIRDNHGGIGLVWWPSRLVNGVGGVSVPEWTTNLIGFLNASWSIKTAFNYSWGYITTTNPSTLVWWNFSDWYLDLWWTNLFWNLFVRGSVWISNSYQDKDSLPTTTQTEALLFNLSDINISTLVNAARKNSSSLCRDKWMSWSSLSSSSSDILCFKNTNLNIDLADAAKYWKKTIVLVNGNVIATNSMKGNNSPLELFIDKGNLYLKDPSVSDLEYFNWEWYPDSFPNDNFQSEFLKWVFIINGLIIWSWSTWPTFQHKLVIHGRITSLNSPEATAKRIQQVNAVLWAGFDGMIDLDNIFVRKCSLGWTGSDSTKCNWAWDVVKKPFVIIDNLDKSMKYKLLNY